MMKKIISKTIIIIEILAIIAFICDMIFDDGQCSVIIPILWVAVCLMNEHQLSMKLESEEMLKETIRKSTSQLEEAYKRLEESNKAIRDNNALNAISKD